MLNDGVLCLKTETSKGTMIYKIYSDGLFAVLVRTSRTTIRFEPTSLHKVTEPSCSECRLYS